MKTATGKQMSRVGARLPVWRAGAAAFLVMLFIWLGVAPSFAHAQLLSTDPTDGSRLENAPSQVRLTFNEPVQVVEGATRLFSSGGDSTVVEAHAVDSTVTVDLPPDLSDGGYSLTYRIISADGHPVGGSVTFEVGHGEHLSPQPSGNDSQDGLNTVLASLLTGVHYLSLLVLAGLVFFEVVIAGFHMPSASKVLRYAYGCALASAALLLPVSGANVAGTDLVNTALEADVPLFLPLDRWMPFVPAQQWVSAGVVALGGLGVVLFTALFAVRSRDFIWRVLALGCAVVALITPVLIGHSQTQEPLWAMLASDMGHLVAGAVWCGGLVGLVLMMGRTRLGVRNKPGATSAGNPKVVPTVQATYTPEFTAEVVRRFSGWALACVVGVALTGVVMVLLIADDLVGLVSSSYGRLLALKLGLVAVVVLLAGWNRFRLLPRVTKEPTVPLRWRALKRVVVLEALVLIAVLLVTGFLSNANPYSNRGSGTDSAGSSGTPQEADFEQESQGLRIVGKVTPATVGTNTVTFTLEYEGHPITSNDVTVTLRLPEQNLGPLNVETHWDPEAGHYEASMQVPASGKWRLQVATRVDSYTEPIVVVPFEVR